MGCLFHRSRKSLRRGSDTRLPFWRARCSNQVAVRFAHQPAGDTRGGRPSGARCRGRMTPAGHFTDHPEGEGVNPSWRGRRACTVVVTASPAGRGARLRELGATHLRDRGRGLRPRRADPLNRRRPGHGAGVRPRGRGAGGVGPGGARTPRRPVPRRPVPQRRAVAETSGTWPVTTRSRTGRGARRSTA